MPEDSSSQNPDHISRDLRALLNDLQSVLIGDLVRVLFADPIRVLETDQH